MNAMKTRTFVVGSALCGMAAVAAAVAAPPARAAKPTAPAKAAKAARPAHDGPQPAAPTPAGTLIADVVRDISAKNIEASVRTLAGFGTRHSLSEVDGDARGVGAARRFIKAEFERSARDSGGRLRVELDEFVAPVGPRVPRPTKMANVVATLSGRQAESRDRLYVVSGHYDSRRSNEMDAAGDAPGADDDASGTAAVLELARVLSKHELDATVVFMAVQGEEQGLLGSKHWADAAADKKLAVAGMITNDIIGSSRGADGKVDRGRVRLFAEGVPAVKDLSPDLQTMLRTGGENDSPPRQLARHIKEAAERALADMKVTVVYRRDRFLRGGDHSPFLDRGFAAVRMTEPAEDFRHQHQDVRVENGVAYGDVPELCDFEYVAQVARVDAAALVSLALAPASPAGVEVETAKLENDTTLRWQPNKEPDLAGYRVVWRETTAPFWQHAADVGNVTRTTLPVSKDDVIFGVEAVDRDGNASPAVYPRPRR